MLKNIQASIITIGTELLIGQTIDTNSAWIGQELNKIGIWVKRRVAVVDDYNDISTALDEESKHADIILITGGLGPTADDITKPLLCKYFGGKMVVNESVLQHIIQLLQKNNRPLLERNLKQAEVPDVCTVIPNPLGTAPGMWFRKNKKIFISMPGVPYEMKGMMINTILPKLSQQCTLPIITHKTLVTADIAESVLAERIQDFENNLPANIQLAYLPNHSMVRLRLTAIGENKIHVYNELNIQFNTLKKQVHDVMIADEDLSIQEIVGKLLIDKKATVASAESCTGGYIAHLITSIAGSSAYYKGSVISYANEIKQNVLNVTQHSLDTVGAVSEQVVTEMAKGVLQTMHTDYAIATSGVMGPTGGTAEKPVGFVWIAVGNQHKIVSKSFQFRFDRLKNIELTAMHALNLLRAFMVDYAGKH